MSSISSTELTTLYVSRAGEKNTSQDHKPANQRVWRTTDQAELTVTGKQESTKMGKAWLTNIQFHQVIAGPSRAFHQTAEHALGAGRIAQIRTVNRWSEIDLRDLEGKAAKEVQELYLRHHPHIKTAPNANECLNRAWPFLADGTRIDFEDYETQFNPRVLHQVNEIQREYPGQVIFLATGYEGPRTLILEAKGTREFYQSEFGQEVAKRAEEKSGNSNLDLTALQIKQLILRDEMTTIKPAGIELKINQQGQLFLNGTYGFRLRPLPS